MYLTHSHLDATQVTHVVYLWHCSVQDHTMSIQCTNVSKRSVTVHRAKLTEIGDSRTVVPHIWGTFCVSSVSRIHLRKSLSNQGPFAVIWSSYTKQDYGQFSCIATFVYSYMAVRHEPNLVLCGKWPSIMSRTLGFFLLQQLIKTLYKCILILPCVSLQNCNTSEKAHLVLYTINR